MNEGSGVTLSRTVEPRGRSRPFRIRFATTADAAVIARHRALMFQDMGQLPPAAFGPLCAAAEEVLAGALARGEYVGWLLTPEEEPAKVVAGAGVQLRDVLPHPVDLGDGKVGVAAGRHGIVLNVFTEPAWRRRGLAEMLMRHVLEWARDQRLDRLVLHASEEGRALYQRLGFVATNEMRFSDSLLGRDDRRG
jgi:GNAT superfamily N-acetyltransferase